MNKEEYIERRNAELKRLKQMLEILQNNPSSNQYLDIDQLKEEIDDINNELNNI